MSSKVVLGIDPGLNGAIVALDEDGKVEFVDIAGSVVGAISWLRTWKFSECSGVVIERVSAMPQQGVSSAYNFGHTCGMLKGACLALRIPILAEPQAAQWKRAVGIALCPPKLSKGATVEEKEAHRQAKTRYKREMDTVSRNRAMELYPQCADLLTRAKDVDRAEAILLAFYGWMILRGGKE